MVDFIQGVVDPRDGHSKCPKGSRSPLWSMFTLISEG